jgi:uncharacterized repeat protein (TIGR01451 family)
MKIIRFMTVAALVAAFTVVAVPYAANASGTWAGTQVDNSALVSWSAGSVGFTTSDTASFLVDELINLQVTNNGATALTVWPGQTNRPLAYDVQNAGNSTIDIRVEAFGDASLFVTNVEIWADDGDGTFDSTLDTNVGASPFDTLSIAVDTVYTYFIVADVPTPATTANTPDTYDLLVTAYRSSAPIPDTSGDPFDANTVQQVMADDGGTYGTDADYDGRDSAQAVYNLVWADLTLTKSFSVIDTDNPFNANQHAIPGATVRYTLHVLNSGTAAATAVTINDGTPLGTVWGAVVNATQGTVTATNPIIWGINSLAGGSSADLVFDVTITP